MNAVGDAVPCFEKNGMAGYAKELTRPTHATFHEWPRWDLPPTFLYCLADKVQFP